MSEQGTSSQNQTQTVTMTHYTETQLKKLSRLLDDRAKALQAHLQGENDRRTDYAEVAGDLADPGDASFADLSVDLEQASIGRDTTEMRAIDTARERIQAGTYGQCIECGVDIPYDRVTAQPTAVRCTPCQELFERFQNDGLGRPAM